MTPTEPLIPQKERSLVKRAVRQPIMRLLPITATMAKIKTSYPKRIRDRLRWWNRQTLHQLGVSLR